MTYYDILEVSQTASIEVIRMAYRALAKKYHPDTYTGDAGFAEYKMKQINEAYDVLSTPEKRRAYDCSLHPASQYYHQEPQQTAYSRENSASPSGTAKSESSKKVNQRKAQSQNQTSNLQDYNSLFRICVWIIVLLGIVFGILSFLSDSPAPDTVPQSSPQIEKSEPTEPPLTPVGRPLSGRILSGSQVTDGSELTITAPSNSDCVVKLKTPSGLTKLMFYVRAGATTTVKVPMQSLYVYFAYGETWYGTEHLFGKETYYSKDNDPLDFSQYTWQYTLQPVTDGNFSATPIDPAEF